MTTIPIRWTAAALFFAASCATAGSRGPGLPAWNHALLWRIERSGGSPSYVLGTIHLADPQLAVLPRALASALTRVESISPKSPSVRGYPSLRRMRSCPLASELANCS
jgi:hypothetical protein